MQRATEISVKHPEFKQETFDACSIEEGYDSITVCYDMTIKFLALNTCKMYGCTNAFGGKKGSTKDIRANPNSKFAMDPKYFQPSDKSNKAIDFVLKVCKDRDDLPKITDEEMKKRSLSEGERMVIMEKRGFY